VLGVTVEEVRGRVAAMQADALAPRVDHEALDSDEHELWQDVLQAISHGAPFADELAHEALQTAHLSFRRGA
jgi:hypothetical protein